MTAYDDQIVIALRLSAQGLVKQTLSDLETVLTGIVSSAARTVPGACGGGLSRFDIAHGRAGHATDPAIGLLDELQHELGQGPCVTAVDHPPESGMVIAHDLAGPSDTDRWPVFAPVAARDGYRSLLSAQLPTSSGKRRAVLNLYSREPRTFTGEACVIAGLFATQASLLLCGAERVAHYDRALDTRDVIGRAKGILSERFAMDDEQAFRMLVKSSQETNVKLVDVARWLTGELGAGHAEEAEEPLDAEPHGADLRIVG